MVLKRLYCLQEQFEQLFCLPCIPSLCPQILNKTALCADMASLCHNMAFRGIQVPAQLSTIHKGETGTRSFWFRGPTGANVGSWHLDLADNIRLAKCDVL